MCITEYNEKVFIDGIRAEGRVEGRAEGEKAKAIQIYNNCIEREMSQADALAITGLSILDIKQS